MIVEKKSVNEMAYTRSEFIDKVISCQEQIMENWCLIRYCSKHDSGNYNINHWKAELQTPLKKIRSLKLKGADKRKVLDYCFDHEDWRDPESVFIYVQEKFFDEGFLEKAKIKDVCLDFCDHIDALVDCLADAELLIRTYFDLCFSTNP